MSESFGRGESALFLANPELAAAARRQRLAEELFGQAVKPRNVGGHAGGLAQMGQALVAGLMGYREDERIKALADAQRAREEEEVRALMGGAMPAAAPGGHAVPATESALATPPGSLPPPIPIGAEAPPMAQALMNPPEQPGQGGAAPAMPLPPPVPVGGPAPSAAPAMAGAAPMGQQGGFPSMEAIIAGMSSSSPRVRATAEMLFRQAQRREDLALRAQDRAEDRAFRERELAARRASTAPAGPPMPFAGTSMDAQYNNIVLTLAPRIRAGTATSDEQAVYQRAFQALSEGQIQFVNDPTDPTGNRQVAVRVPRNMGDLPQPGGGQAPAAAQGMTAPVSQPGGPSSAVAPQANAPVPAQAQDAMPAAPAAVPGFERMRPAPTGYQWRADGLIEPMPGGPADPRTQGLTEAQSRTNFFGAQMKMGDEILRSVTVPSNAMLLAYRNLPSVPVNYGASANDQMYFNAARLFAAGVLRKETGAAMTPGEVLDVAERFFPTPFDRPQVIEQKARARQQIISSIAAELPGGQLRGELPSTTGPGGRGEASPPPRPTSRMRWNPQTNQLEPAQ